MRAVDVIEDKSGISIRKKELVLTTSWEGAEPVRLFRGPVTKISSVKYFLSGSRVTLDVSNYELSDLFGGQLVLAAGNSWPSPGATVEIGYEAGSGILEGKAFQAVAMLTAHYYMNREAVDSTGKSRVVSLGVEEIINLMMSE